MSEMLDAVRAAIVRGLLASDADGVISNTASGLVLDGRFDLDAVARTVIAAQRQPTKAMFNAARDWARRNAAPPMENDAITGWWQAMNDAALK